jgi:hypothetical protein
MLWLRLVTATVRLVCNCVLLLQALVLRDEHIAGLQEALRIFSRQGIGSSSTAAATAAAAQPPPGSFLATATAAAAAADDSKQNRRKEDSWEGEGTCSEALAAAGAAGRAVSEVCSIPPAATAATADAGEPVSAAAAAATAAATTAADGLAKVMEDALAPDFKPLTQDRGYTAEVGFKPKFFFLTQSLTGSVW